MTHPFRGRAPLLFALFTVILVADRITKAVAEAGLPLGRPQEVIPGFFNLTLVHNTGMAFGILDSAEIPGKMWLLTGVSTILVVGIGWLALRGGPFPARTRFGFTAMLAGAVGNILDRLLYGGYVVDFLDFHLAGFHWPAFNIADAMLCTGAGLIVLDSVRDLRASAAETRKERAAAG